MTIKINYKQLPRNLARNIILEDNPCKDDTSFVGQMLKHSSWNDREYSKFEYGFLDYVGCNRSGYKREVFQIVDNILQVYDKYFNDNYVDFYTCSDEYHDVDTFYRFEYLEWLMNNLTRAPRDSIDLLCNLKKTIQYNTDNITHQSTIIGISGFDELNKARFKYLSCIGLTHALVHMKILNINSCISSLSEIYNPYKIYNIAQNTDYLSWDYNNKDSYNLYKSNNTIAIECMLKYNKYGTDNFFKSNNKMSVIIAKKFHKDFYNIFDSDTGLISKNKLIDLVNKHDAFALWFNDKSIEESELEILYGKQVKIGDCNG